jgi:HEAT repeat protein
MLVPLGERGARALAKGFGHANPDVRSVVGESLFAIADAEGGLSHIRPAIDLALAAGGPAAKEMPWLLAELEDEDAPKVIAEFLKSEDTEVVTEAIEALADFGDPASVPVLKALLKDKRVVKVEGEDEGDELQEWTIGELAGQAIEMIEEEEE